VAGEYFKVMDTSFVVGRDRTGEGMLAEAPRDN